MPDRYSATIRRASELLARRTGKNSRWQSASESRFVMRIQIISLRKCGYGSRSSKHSSFSMIFPCVLKRNWWIIHKKNTSERQHFCEIQQLKEPSSWDCKTFKKIILHLDCRPSNPLPLHENMSPINMNIRPYLWCSASNSTTPVQGSSMCSVAPLSVVMRLRPCIMEPWPMVPWYVLLQKNKIAAPLSQVEIIWVFVVTAGTFKRRLFT